MSDDLEAVLPAIAGRLKAGAVIPYLGPGMLSLCREVTVPANPLELAQRMTARVSVPHKIRNRLTQAAQFIENFKHRRTVVSLMNEAFAAVPAPSALHRALAGSGAALWVDTWYDDTFATALAEVRPPGGWAQIQGLSQSEHFGQWTGAYAHDGAELADVPAGAGVLYRPIGGRSPRGNYLVSDSDYVEVLTEIDIQTPIPSIVQSLRAGRHFLFLGCRFDDQLARSFARQIMKRSSGLHWAVLPDGPTRMEARFLAEQNIRRIAAPLPAVADALIAALDGAAASAPDAAAPVALA